MSTDWVFGLDVWEGNLDIDEQAIKAGGVSFLIPRLNSTYGTLHKDDNFDAQWEQAKIFVRFPYFVYTPWATGRENFEWMAAYLPSGVKRVAVDVEIVRAGYSPIEYSAHVKAFLNLCAQVHLWPVVYTGQWFVPNLSAWPAAEYWWARYPYSLYPTQSLPITWDGLKVLLGNVAWNPNCTLGACRLWQCSGDRFKPYPGCQDRAVDINLWNGTLDELRAWVGESQPARSWSVEIDAWARTKGYAGVGPT